jgi:hypothetical protein
LACSCAHTYRERERERDRDRERESENNTEREHQIMNDSHFESRSKRISRGEHVPSLAIVWSTHLTFTRPYLNNMGHSPWRARSHMLMFVNQLGVEAASCMTSRGLCLALRSEPSSAHERIVVRGARVRIHVAAIGTESMARREPLSGHEGSGGPTVEGPALHASRAAARDDPPGVNATSSFAAQYELGRSLGSPGGQNGVGREWHRLHVHCPCLSHSSF